MGPCSSRRERFLAPSRKSLPDTKRCLDHYGCHLDPLVSNNQTSEYPVRFPYLLYLQSHLQLTLSFSFLPPYFPITTLNPQSTNPRIQSSGREFLPRLRRRHPSLSHRNVPPQRSQRYRAGPKRSGRSDTNRAARYWKSMIGS